LGKKKTTEQFKKELLAVLGEDYEVIGEYEGARKPVFVLHKPCNSKNPMTPTNALRKRGCKVCFGPKIRNKRNLKEKLMILQGENSEL
jgi:hypothetical protein